MLTNTQTKMKKGYKSLLEEANAVIETLSVAEALNRIKDDDVIFIDIRDMLELIRDGLIPDAIHASRGMLEFLVDPDSPYHHKAFSSGKKFLLYCASGGRSALATRCLQDMGLNKVAHIGGGFKAWEEAKGPVKTIA